MNLPRESLAVLLADAEQHGVPLVIVAVSQPKMVHLPEKLNGLRLLILNQGELETRMHRPLPTDDDLLAACKELRAAGARDVIVTRGGTGVVYTTADGIAHMDAQDAHIVDVTGAGDAFAAAVCWSLYQGNDDLELACRRGLRASAITLACEETVCPNLTPEMLSDPDDQLLGQDSQD
jgi:pseudouridine kinase